MTVTATTAEWLCTRCGSTNRLLVPSTTSETVDECSHCHILHVIRPGVRPVRWEAVLKN